MTQHDPGRQIQYEKRLLIDTRVLIWCRRKLSVSRSLHRKMPRRHSGPPGLEVPSPRPGGCGHLGDYVMQELHYYYYTPGSDLLGQQPRFQWQGHRSAKPSARVVGHLEFLNIGCDVADPGKSLPQVARLCLRSFRRETPSHTSWS